ncbi:hypothetical protein K438DRAFT_1784997 [Mycena galopus ATCC 62051]|nr:hypothetical protein K438DRAFT_1784997 [Mycena galopus ATCC 62051]
MSGKRERRDGDAPAGELSGAMGGVYCDATTGGVTTSGGGLLPCAGGGWTTGAVRATVAAAAAACEDRSAARSASSCDSTFSRRRSAEVCAVASLPGGRLLGPASSGMVMCQLKFLRTSVWGPAPRTHSEPHTSGYVENFSSVGTQVTSHISNCVAPVNSSCTNDCSSSTSRSQKSSHTNLDLSWARAGPNSSVSCSKPGSSRAELEFENSDFKPSANSALESSGNQKKNAPSGRGVGPAPVVFNPNSGRVPRYFVQRRRETGGVAWKEDTLKVEENKRVSHCEPFRQIMEQPGRDTIQILRRVRIMIAIAEPNRIWPWPLCNQALWNNNDSSQQQGDERCRQRDTAPAGNKANKKRNDEAVAAKKVPKKPKRKNRSHDSKKRKNQSREMVSTFMTEAQMCQVLRSATISNLTEIVYIQRTSVLLSIKTGQNLREPHPLSGRGVPAGWVISRNTGGGVRGDGGGSTWRGVAGGGDCGRREAKRPFSRNWFR